METSAGDPTSTYSGAQASGTKKQRFLKVPQWTSSLTSSSLHKPTRLDRPMLDLSGWFSKVSRPRTKCRPLSTTSITTMLRSLLSTVEISSASATPSTTCRRETRLVLTCITTEIPFLQKTGTTKLTKSQP